ncbi:glycosyltransferase family 25 protein [Chelativorans salis]|uniref:Glycosyltransferase family 25 protein n=1 Tax=Chelativorans salis TaxID=2978478 RepID=A0ABT2LJT9_9HYPH|nr:glycosyltransferase family 25 protein [Chelativorans sp. EGI FJ00035]MCT7374872.1 glycosyltransferase family 25 protein [Chelativorans sp. EGI FJ00035]
MKAEAFIIHLARAHGRARQVERLRQSLPLPVTVIDAVDGQTLPEEKVAEVYKPRLHRPRYPFPLRISEIACFLSHRKAWAAIVDRKLDAGLVVEDDVEIDTARFAEVFDLALAHMQGNDLVRFPKKARGEKGRVAAHSGVARLIAPRHPRLGMQAQLVSRDAAKALLTFTHVFDRPVDTTVQMQWLHGVRVLSAMPVAIREVAGELGGTTVQGKGKPFVEVLAREVQRTIYRASVRARNVLDLRMLAR